MGMTPLINVLLAHLIATNNDGAPLTWKVFAVIAFLLLNIILQGYSAISVSEEKGIRHPHVPFV